VRNFRIREGKGLSPRCRIHTVVETQAYLLAAARAGLTEDERTAVVDYLAEFPSAGAVIPGTGGCRKLRIAQPGGGKSGGYRTITFFSGPDLPVFLITVFSKRERSDLTAREREGLRPLTKSLVATYRRSQAAGRIP
jgi:hypothetical protein